MDGCLHYHLTCDVFRDADREMDDEVQLLLPSQIPAMGTRGGGSGGGTPAAIILLAVFSAIGGFLFGYDTGVVSGAMILVRDEFELSTVWHELIVSSTIGAAWLAALAAGPATDRFGRRPVILVASVVFTVGAVVMGAAPEKVTLLIGRIIVGLGIGMASMSVPVYLSESSPADLRGRITVTNNIFITGGQLIASVICGAFSKVPQGWRYMLGLAALPSVVQLMGFAFMPESPRWLILKGRTTNTGGGSVVAEGKVRKTVTLHIPRNTPKHHSALCSPRSKSGCGRRRQARYPVREQDCPAFGLARTRTASGAQPRRGGRRADEGARET
nr:proton myo-inositol cotransporter-like [Penaeus vannamei]